MSADPDAQIEEMRKVVRRNLRHELEAIRGKWGWLLALGIALLIFGTIAIGAPVIMSLATAMTIGVLLLFAGVAQLVGAFWTRDWSGFFLVLMLAVLYIVVGLLFLNRPVSALEAVTLLLAASLLIGGLFRAIGSAMYQFPQWGWTFASGLIETGLGLMIWQQWPLSGFWVVGLFVGIDMIFSGWIWIALALRLKNLGARLHHHAEPPASV